MALSRLHACLREALWRREAGFVLGLLLSATTGLAQQDPIYSQYLLNPLVINPAYAGINNNLHASASYRIQWMNLEGQPRTLNANGSISLVNNKVGAGVTILQDRIGGTTITEFNASFSYKLALGNNNTFSFGMQGGLLGFRNDYSGLNIFDPGDVAFAEGVTRTSRVNIGAGAILKSEQYMIGISVPRLLPSTMNTNGQQFDLYNQHYYLFGSYVFMATDRLNLKPAVLVRAVSGAPASIDAAMNLCLNMIHTAGIFTRNFNTYGVLLQTLLLEKYRFAYVFELPTNRSVGTAFTTHEISFGIRIAPMGIHDKALTNF